MARYAGCAELLYTERADCGCPEEHYLFNGVDLSVHYDADGEADAFMDWADDGEASFSVRDQPSRHAARIEIFAWAHLMTSGPTA